MQLWGSVVQNNEVFMLVEKVFPATLLLPFSRHFKISLSCGTTNFCIYEELHVYTFHENGLTLNSLIFISPIYYLPWFLQFVEYVFLLISLFFLSSHRVPLIRCD